MSVISPDNYDNEQKRIQRMKRITEELVEKLQNQKQENEKIRISLKEQK